MSRFQACFPVKPNYKKHHPPIVSCCLRVGQQPLQSRCFLLQRDDLCPAEWLTLGKRSRPVAEGPGWPHCCRHKSGHGCCAGAGECQHFHHPAGIETRSGSVPLRRDSGPDVKANLCILYITLYTLYILYTLKLRSIGTREQTWGCHWKKWHVFTNIKGISLAWWPF